MSDVIRYPVENRVPVRGNAVQRVRVALLMLVIALAACAAGLAHNPNEYWFAIISLMLGICGASAVLFSLRRAGRLKPKPVAVIRHLAFHPSATVWAPHYHSTHRPPTR